MEDMIGKRIGRYEVQAHIGRGGMADVYLAYDVELKRKIALKILLPMLAQDTAFVERFRREAQTVARLDHPNIVNVFDIGTTEQLRPYIAMQYIGGGSLQDRLVELKQRGKLVPTAQALAIIRQMAEALSVAHQAGIVHRDLKPANILIRDDGTPVLVDLGIAAVEGSSRLTQTGGIIGTPHYMSPEQVLDHPLDGRSDLYSLGVILYELLTGVRPFEANESIAILHKQVYEEPIPLQQLRTDLSPQTITIVHTSLQKDPLNRYQKAMDLIAVLESAIISEGKGVGLAKTTVLLPNVDEGELISRQKVLNVPASLTPLLVDRLKVEKASVRQFVAISGLIAVFSVVVVVLMLRFLPQRPLIVSTSAMTVEVEEMPAEKMEIAETKEIVSPTEIPPEPTSTLLPTKTPELPTPTYTPELPTSTPASYVLDLVSEANIAVSGQASDAVDTCGDTVTYNAANLVDSKSNTAWRVEGDGQGAFIYLDFNRQVTLTKFSILPGYDKRDPCDQTIDWCLKNRIPQRIRLRGSEGQQIELELLDDCFWQEFSLDSWQTETLNIQILASYSKRSEHRIDYTTISEISLSGY